MIYQCVDAVDGSDAFNGRSWERPKLTLDAAFAALPDGGAIYMAPTPAGTGYTPSGTLTIDGHFLIGCASPRAMINVAPWSDAPQRGECRINHSFSGHLFNWKGGKISGALLYNTVNGASGAALHSAPTSSQHPHVWSFLEDVTVSGDYAWQHGLYADGSAHPTYGFRTTWFRGCTFFGTTGTQIYMNMPYHVRFTDCQFDATLGASSLVIAHAYSGDVNFTACYLNGDFTTAAATSMYGTPIPVTWIGGAIHGNIVCQAGSNYNRFAPAYLGGTFTNNGGAQNAHKLLAA